MASSSTRAAVCIGVSHLFSGAPRDPANADRARRVAESLHERQWPVTLLTDDYQGPETSATTRCSRKGVLDTLRSLRDRTWATQAPVRDILLYLAASSTRPGIDTWDREVCGHVAPDEIADILRGLFPNTRVTIFCDAPFDTGISLPVHFPCETDLGDYDPRQFWQCAIISIWSRENRLADILSRERLPQAVAGALSAGIGIRLCYSSVPRVRRILDHVNAV